VPRQAAPTDGLPLYDVQLRDAYLLDARVERRARTKGDPDAPALDASVRAISPAADRTALDMGLGAKVLVPYNDEQYIIEIDCTINGRFSASGAKPETYWDAFANREGIALLWPYVRSTVGEVGRLTGIPIPILPTLDVLAVVGPTSPPEPKPRARRKRASAKRGGSAVAS
jgi:hypothetical protein